MCGIVGYIGKNNFVNHVLEGLKDLEYRGYDSSGLSYLQNNNISTFKAVGKINNLEEKLKNVEVNDFGICIGHTRWATHGKPTEINAHPHSTNYSSVVHNGIIENYLEIKDDLISKGHNIISQTDTEVIVHLFEEECKIEQDLLKAFKNTIDKLDGAYAILLINVNSEDIFFAKKGSPLIIGKNDKELFLSSSDTPLIGNCEKAIYLEDYEWGYCNKDDIYLFNNLGEKQELNFNLLPGNKNTAQKNGYRFFMEKEIYEQSVVSSETLIGRVKDEEIVLDEIDDSLFDNIEHIVICACGTSYHSGLLAGYLIERYARIHTSVEISSEYRYKNPIIDNKTLFISISQSGETADTLECLKMAKKFNAKTLCICNVDNSSIVRLSDNSILTRAGIEKGVASTKAFATQSLVAWILSLYIGQVKNNLSKSVLKDEISNLIKVPKCLEVSNKLHEKCKRLSKRYLHGHGFFFIGRDVFYPLALEGALKLKEISYMHAIGYPAGEMKHGPIALADPELFTICLLSENLLNDKTKSNIEELSARDSTICVIGSENVELADDNILTNKQNHYMLEYFEQLVVLQVLSMEISIRLGNDVDMPRNLAKSVTVE